MQGQLGTEQLETRKVLASASLAGFMPDLRTIDDTGFDGADNYTNAATLRIDFNPAGVTFNANGGAGENLQLLVNGTVTGGAIAVPGGVYAAGNVTFTVPAGAILNDGPYSVSVRSTDGVTPGAASNTLIVTIDRTAPTIDSQTPPTSTTAFTPTQNIDFQVTWDENVYTSATAAVNAGAAPPAGATLPLVIGTLGSTASPVQNSTATVLGGAASGSGTSTLTFRHIVGNPDSNDADGVQVFAATNTLATGTAVWLGGSAVNFIDATDRVTLVGHGLDAGAIVSFSAIAGGTTGIATNTNYFVINPTANDFQLAATSGGGLLPLTTNGNGTLNGQLNFINLGVAGTGYSSTNPPTVTISGGGGINAAATATVNAGGVLTGFTVTNPGSGYTSAPTISVGFPSPTSATIANRPVDRAGNVASGAITNAPITTSVLVVNQTGTTASSGAFVGVTNGELRTTSVSSVTLSVLNGSFPVGAGVGSISTADFVLTRNGVAVAGFPGTATLTYPQSGTTAYSQFMLGNLDQFTNAPGSYVLSFQDLGVCPVVSINWVKSTPTAAELVAVLTPLPSFTAPATSDSPRFTPVNSVRVRFGDNTTSLVNPAPTTYPPVIGINTSATGVNITQFTLYHNGVVVPWNDANLASVTITGSNTTYYVNGLEDYVRQNPGSYELRLNRDTAIQTLDGIQLVTSYSAAWEYVAPTTFTVTAPADRTYRLGENLVFTATFDDNVSFTTAPTLALTIGTSSVNSVCVSGNNTRVLTFRYTVAGTDVDVDGISLATTISGTVTDSRGNVVPPAFTAINTSGIRIDGTVPTATIAPPAAGTYVTNNNLDLVATLSESVIVSGNPSIPVTIGGVVRQAAYQASSDAVAFTDVGDIVTLNSHGLSNGAVVSFSAIASTTGIGVNTAYYVVNATTNTFQLASTAGGTALPLTTTGTGTMVRAANTMTFRYTLVAGDVSGGGLTIGQISLNGGTVRDAAGNDATLTYVAPTVTGVIINRTAPNVTVSSGLPTAPATTKTSKVGDVIELSVAFTQNVTVTGVPTIGLTVGSAARTASYISGTGTSTIRFQYVVQAGDQDTDGIAIPAAVISLPGGATIADVAGTPVLSFTQPTTTTVLVDGVVPTVAITSSVPAVAPGGGATITFTLSEAATDFVIGDVTVTGGTLGALSPNGANTVFTSTFTPNAGFTGAANISVPAGVFTDAAGNTNTAANFTLGVAPTVTIAAAPATVRAGQTSQLTFTLSEAISTGSLTAADVAVTGGTIGALTGSGTIFTTTFTPAANFSGNAVVSVGAGAFTDAAGNDNTAATPLSIAVDTIAPTVSISSSVSSVASGSTATITFTLSEASTDFTINDVTVTGGILGTWTPVSSTSYTAVFTPNASFSGAANITVPAGSFSDSAGNVSTAAASLAVAVNTVSPTVTVTSSTATIRNNQTALITFTLSAASTTFTAADFSAVAPAVANVTVTGGTLSNFISVSPTVYMAVFTPSAPATLGTVSVAAGSFTDANSNQNLAGGLATPITIDVVAPTVTIAAAPATVRAGQTSQLTFTLSEAISTGSLTAADVAVTGGTIGALTGSGTIFTTTFTPAANFSGNAVVSVGAGAFTDAAGNDNTAATPLSIAVDTIAPTVAGITAPSAILYATGDSLTFTVTTSENVVVVGTPTLSFTLGSVGRQASYVAGSSTATSLVFTYTILAGDSSSTGLTATAISLSGASIKDTVGNDANISFSPVSVTGAIVNRTTLSSVTASADKTYKSGDVIEFTATFSQPVSVTGVPSIGIAIGNNARNALYSSGSGTTSLKFRYNVVAGDLDPNGIDIPLSVISLAGAPAATIVDGGNNAVALSFTPPVTTNLLVDAVGPQTLGTIAGPAAGSYQTGDKLSFTVPFNDTVTVTGTPTLAFTIGGITRQASYSTGTGTTTLTFDYTVVAGDAATNVVLAANAISTSGGTVKDAAGNDATLTSAANTFNGVNVNRLPATVTVTGGSGKTSKIGDVIELTATFAQAVTVTGTPTIGLTVGSTAKTAAYVSGTGTTAIKFRYTVVVGDLDSDGVDVIGIINLPGTATVVDSTGAVLLSFTPPTTTTVLVDAVAPQTLGTIAGPPAGSYQTADTLSFTVPFNDIVTVTGTPTLAFTIGGITRQASYSTGTGATTLTFEYTVVAGDAATSVVLAANAISLSGGTVKDAAGNDATLVTAANTFNGIAINRISSAVGGVSVSSGATRLYKFGEAIDFAVTFNKPVTVTGAPQLSFTIGGTPTVATYLNGSGTSVVTFRHLVTGMEVDSDGIDMTTSSIALPGGATIVDAIGNAADLTFVPPVTSGVTVDGQAPTIVPNGVILPHNGSYKLGAVLTFTFTMSEPVIVTGNPTLPITIGTNVRTGTFVAPVSSPSKTITFQYTVVDTDIGPTSFSLGSLSLGTATVRDVAGNDASLAYTASSTAAILVDGAKPTVTSIRGTTNGTYTTGNVVSIQATFSENVVVNGLPPTLRLNSVPNTATRFATYATGSGTSTLTFRYVVQDGDTSPDLDYFDNASLIVAAGSSVRDTAGNDADLTLAAPGAVNSIGFLNDVVIDTLPPSVVSFTSNTINGSYKAGQQVRINATLSEPIATGRTFDVTLDTGAIVTLTTNGTTTASGVYTIANEQNSSDLTVVDLAAGTLLDSAGNTLVLTVPTAPNNLADNKNIIVDTVAPTVAIASDKAALKSGETAIITFTLSENSTNFIAGDVTSTGGTLSGFAGTGSVYTATFTPTVGFTTPGQVSVAANAFTDAATNGNQAATLLAPITIDTIAPTIAISSSAGALKAGDTATITFTLSENSTNFVDGDVTVSGGTLSSLSGSGSVYTAVFTPTVSSTTSGQISVTAGQFTDAAGNGNLASILLTLPIDTVVPTVAITSDKTTLGIGQTATITFTLSENSTTFTIGGVTVSGGTLSGFGGTGSIYTAIFTPTVNSTTPGSVFVGANAFTDAAGNGNTASLLSPALVIDTIVPTVTVTSSVAALKGGQTATIFFTLSDSTNQFTDSDITVVGGTLSSLSGSGTSYSAVFTPAANSTTPGQVSVAANAFTDATGNGNIPGQLAQPLSIDTIAPTLFIATSKPALKIGETATISFALSEASTNFTAASVTVTGGSLTNLTGSGTAYTATFTPAVNSTVAGTIAVAANSFTDAAGNGNTAFSLPTPIAIDTLAPTIAITSSKSALKIGDTATITFTLSEPSVTFSPASLAVVGGSLSSFAGTGASYSAIFAPSANSTTTGSITVANNAFFDAAGNGNVAGALSPTITIDTIAPTVTIASNKAALKIGDTATITFTLSEASSDFIPSDVTVSGGTLSGFVGAGTSYTATFTPTASSTVAGSISVAASSFTDGVGNGNIAGALTTPLSIDTVAPTVTVTTSKAALKIGETATILLTLSETSTNFVSSDVTVTGGTLSGFAGSGTVYSATFTPTANSTAPGAISVTANNFTDAAGNGNVTGTLTPSITVDTIAPTVSISSSKAALKSGDTATITFTLSESATDFTAADVAVTGGAISGFTGSGTSYTATFTPTANSTSDGTVSVAATTFTDPAGNANVASQLTPSLSIDTVAPTVAISSHTTALRIGETATITFTLSEPSTTFALGDVTAAGGTLSNFTGSGASYSATFTPAATSTASGTISVAASAFTDTAGNGNIAGSLATPIAIDTIAPTVAISSNKANLKSGDTATITFTLSDSTNQFTASDIAAAGGTLSGFTGSGTSYSAVFTPNVNSTVPGSISVAPVAFNDAAGNANDASALTPSIIIDTVAPTITITSNKAALKSGDTATITFTLSESSATFAAADVTSAGGTLSGFTGSGASYTATFTPTASSTTPGSISVAAGTFTDAAGNPNIAGQLSPTLTVDTVAPTISIVSNASALRSGETATITFTLSEPSTNFTLADVAAVGGTISGLNGSGTSYTATFTPNAGSTTPGSVSVAAATFTDPAGNANVAGSLATPISIDTVAPTISITSNKAALKSGDTATITFTLSESATDFTVADVAVAGGTISDFAGSGTTYSAMFTPAANSTASGSVSVAAARFSDAAGNANLAGSLAPTITIDTVAPTVTITSNKAALKSGDTATITFTLSKSSTTFAAADVAATGGTISGFAGSGASYTATFTPDATSTTPGSVSVAAGTFTDSAGNGNVSGLLSPTLSIDTAAPVVTGFTTSTAAGSYGPGQKISITATISEAVRAGSSFVATLNTGATVALTTATSGTTLAGDYTVSAGENVDQLAVVSYTAGSTVDVAGNGLTVLPVAGGMVARANINVGGPFSASNIPTPIAIDTTAATVVNFGSPLANGTYATGAVIPITATLSETVQAGGSISVTLNTGAVVTLVALAQGTVLTGNYIVRPGDVTFDLDVISYQVTGGAVVDLAGNATTNTALPDVAGRLATLKNIAIDASVKVSSGIGFSTNPNVIADKRGPVTAVPITFTTPVSGVRLAAIRVFYNGRSISLRGASITGSGANYLLRLPARSTTPKGFYTVQVLPTTGIRAISNGAAMTQTLEVYWGNGRSLGVTPTARAKAFGRI